MLGQDQILCTRRAAVFAGLCLCCLPTGLRADTPVELIEAAPGIHVRRGVDQDATAANRDAIANIGYIEGDTHLLVTDPGGSLADGKALLAAIRARSRKPIRYVVLSHVHPDHIFGAGAFLSENPVFLGHANLQAALASRGEFYRAHLADIVGAANAGPIVQPTQLVATSMDIDLGNRRVSVTAHKPAHTSTDLSMLDHRTGTLLPADLLFVGRVPSLDGSLNGWLAELAALQTIRPARAIPGHGPVSVDFAAASDDLARYLRSLRDETRAAIAGGRGITDATNSVAQSERHRWTLFDDYNARNVTEAYKELEWE